jgi:hypothetical protein
VNLDPLDGRLRRLFASLTHAGDAVEGSDEPAALLTVQGEAGREQRGTRVRFTLKFYRGELVQARYRAYGCPHTLAVCEWLAQELEAGHLASIGEPADWCRTLGVPIVKLGRLLVVQDALRAALNGAALKGSEAGKNVVK